MAETSSFRGILSGVLGNLMPDRMIRNVSSLQNLGALQNLDNQNFLEEHRFFNYPTETLSYIANKPDDYDEMELRIASQILSTRPPLIDPMQSVTAPDGGI